ncbi:MAG: UDP-N-acetylmuramoyl-L-alanine--D-glutamate ligase [Gammaproteobacteria bacterium]|nr:UDP-N-acetylmuramoyl-L-alanine--D-glutamate ligase [Gammaproteobacteria bacterium]
MNKKTQNKLFDFTIPTLIVGMGGTGLSCARYLKKRDCSFAVADSRDEQTFIEGLKEEFSPLEIMAGDFEFEQFKNYQQIIVSPGISIRSEFFKSLQEQGCFILGDIEIFAQVVDKPVIAITGSNGKSTVTTLVEKIAQHCGVKAIAGGNLGIPALNLLDSQSDLYILELSSFQLETTYSLHTLSATVLNVSEDHMDRYDDLDDYRKIKESIYNNTDNAVVNIDEKITFDRVMNVQDKEYSIAFFGQNKTDNKLNNFYSLFNNTVLVKDNNEIVHTNEIKLKGTYNHLNVLAALALLEPLQLDQKKQVEAIKEYKGLSHRCEWVEKVGDVEFFNDSKGTNTGATIAAIDGLELESNKDYLQRKVILIAGGVGKGADFTELGRVIEKKIKSTILMGVDSELIKSCALNAGAKNDSLYSVESMTEAVSTAAKIAKSGDVVLFSPACASFDMYQNYMKRGDDFKEKVLTLKKTLNSELKNVS